MVPGDLVDVFVPPGRRRWGRVKSISASYVYVTLFSPRLDRFVVGATSYHPKFCRVMKESPMTTPLITLAGDKPRARRTDSVASHLAADRNARVISKQRLGVLLILAADGEMTGAELNADWRNWHVVGSWEFPVCHFDSPRKRAGELADDGLVDVVAHRHGTVEAVYRISPEGRALLEGLGL